MPPPASTLTIAGTDYPATGTPSRAGSRCALDRLTRSLDEADTLEFHQVGQTLPATWHEGQAVALAIGTTPAFAGELVRVDYRPGPDGWTVAYTAQGLKYLGNKIAVTDSVSGLGTITYNLPSDDPDYLAASSGLSVGVILGDIFTAHAAQLAAAGIAGFLPGDLTGLTLVPPEPVTFAGPALFNAVDTFLDRWAGHCSCWIEYRAGTTDWRIRVGDTTAFPVTTFTLGTDPIEPPSLTRDTSGSSTRVVIRGRSNVEAAYLSTKDGTLTKGWTGADETAWKWSDWINPNGATDTGVASSVGSTTVTVGSDDAARAWAANFWSTNQGSVWLVNPAATGITQQEYRKVTACTALAAGGTATLTLDRPLANGGYTRYALVCQPPGSKVNVWRTYNVTNTQAIGHLVRRFNAATNWANNGTIVQTWYPIAAIVYGLREWPGTFEINPLASQIRFTEPVVKSGNTQANLDTGGGSVAAPDNVKALVAYSRGTLTAVAPASGYSGTAFTVLGIQRTWTLDVSSWVNAADQANLNALAALRLATVRDAVVDGTVVYHGLYLAGLTPGLALSITGNGYTTGWEALAAPVREFAVTWPADGASNWISTFRVNNRRKAATGDSYYLHPAFTGGASWDQGSDVFVAAPPGALGAAPAAASGLDQAVAGGSANFNQGVAGGSADFGAAAAAGGADFIGTVGGLNNGF